MNTYRHTQFGKVIVVVMGTAIVILIASAAIPLAVLPASAWGRRNSHHRAARQHSGIPRHSLGPVRQPDGRNRRRVPPHLLWHRPDPQALPLDQIDTCRPVSNPWIYGLGIRLTPHGWLYNVSGVEAVELKMKSGKTCRIGTDEPEVLTSALQKALDSSKPAPE